MEASDRQVSQINEELSIDMLDYKVKQSIVASALKAILKTIGNGRKKVMPWGDERCKEAVGNTNKAFM